MAEGVILTGTARGRGTRPGPPGPASRPGTATGVATCRSPWPGYPSASPSLGGARPVAPIGPNDVAEPARRPREFCSPWCRGPVQVLRNGGPLPGGPGLLLHAADYWSLSFGRNSEG
ncbi:hypothetical protein FGD71_008560 [Streptomyces sporangiiformans]|uniref:Uncharacterized protein n=1 Tax=Streptomyces sporangiiformans TaxID=2315329 RepID=A0A505DMW9_9ACTN|nr:hypothetical protein FGD71_008560 [Streptomyces sporangiiformans]